MRKAKPQIVFSISQSVVSRYSYDIMEAATTELLKLQKATRCEMISLRKDVCIFCRLIAFPCIRVALERNMSGWILPSVPGKKSMDLESFCDVTQYS